MRLRDWRYGGWGIAVAALVGLPLVAGFVSFGWEIGEGLGLVALIACVVLSGSPVRPRDAEPPTLLTLDRHQALGWWALGLAAAHAAVAVLADRVALEYLKPTLPWYQIAGLVALVGLLLLNLTALGSWRRRVWASHRGFQATHIVGACLVLVLIVVHVLVTGRYAGSTPRRLLVLAASGFALLMLLRARRAAPGTSAVASRLAFGRHGFAVAACIAISVAAMLPLSTGWLDMRLREAPLARHAPLPFVFDHGKHAPVNCLKCHHNYTDGTGFDTCVHCHRQQGPKIKVGLEARFHDFCLDCHRHPDAALEHHGPVSGCTTCHRPPAATTGVGR